jgi:hypothetical protein
MLDLRDDGTIGIDFEDGSPTVVLARPKFGAYKRLRAGVQKMRDDLVASLTELRAQEPPLEAADLNAQAQDYSDGLTLAWWDLVLLGDESFKSLVESGTVPPSHDDWPAYLVYGTEVISKMVEHWRNIPLARGGRLETPPPPAE